MTRDIYELWLELNAGLIETEVTFLDRGLPDALSFYRFAGMNPNSILLDCFQHRYATVFLLNRLPYQQDGSRGGDEISATYFDRWMERDLNNAHLASLQTYSQWVRALRHLLQQLDGDLEAFHARCEQLAELEIAQRQRALERLDLLAEQACRQATPDLPADQPCPPYH